MIKTPDFWSNRGLLAVLLLPFAGLWAGATVIRNALALKQRRHYQSSVLAILALAALAKRQ